MVHGDCVSIGCYAMTDPFIEEIYGMVQGAQKGGQREVPVHIFPFRMTPENMKRHSDSNWFGFWQNLKEGYDLFETTCVPPTVTVDAKRYTFR